MGADRDAVDVVMPPPPPWSRRERRRRSPRHRRHSIVGTADRSNSSLQYFSGTSRHGAPARSRHRMPLMTLRLSSGGRPRPTIPRFSLNRQQNSQNTALDLCQIAAAQGCLLEIYSLNSIRNSCVYRFCPRRLESVAQSQHRPFQSAFRLQFAVQHPPEMPSLRSMWWVGCD